MKPKAPAPRPAPRSLDQASGRQRLMAAALHLAASTRSLASLGLREVARHAGLNPNTFYRHFKDFDELGLAVIEQLIGTLRQGLRERRLRPANDGLRLSDFQQPAEVIVRVQSIVSESVALVLDFVTEHQEAYIVGIRELHGTSPILRKALRDVLQDLGTDMAEDIHRGLQLPWLDAQEVEEIAQMVVRQMTFFSLDYLEQPERRADICREAEKFILWLFWGAIAAKSPATLRDVPPLMPSTTLNVR